METQAMAAILFTLGVLQHRDDRIGKKNEGIARSTSADLILTLDILFKTSVVF